MTATRAAMNERRRLVRLGVLVVVMTVLALGYVGFVRDGGIEWSMTTRGDVARALQDIENERTQIAADRQALLEGQRSLREGRVRSIQEMSSFFEKHCRAESAYTGGLQISCNPDALP